MNDEQQDQLREIHASKGGGGGARISMRDGRVSALINWIWAALGSVALLIGIGVYNKLSDLNDTIIRAVVQIENQSNEIKEIKSQQAEMRKDMDSLRAQMYSLEGKTLRGIEGISRGK